MRRIAVIGTSCSGKTTLARQLADHFHIPHTQLDELYWLPNWTEREAPDFLEKVDQVTSQESWVIDGNYSVSRDLIWGRADTVIWLNYEFAIVFLRALRRTLHRAWTREELFSGNFESFRLSFFSRDSILLWVIQSWRRVRKRYRALFDTRPFDGLQMLEFTHPIWTNQWLEALRDSGPADDEPGTPQPDRIS